MIWPSRVKMTMPMILASTKRRILTSKPLANSRTAASAPFARGDLQFEVLNRLHSLIRQGRELPEGAHEPLIFCVELATIAVHDRPYRPDCFAPDVKR